MSAEPQTDTRPDPPGWNVRFLNSLTGWEARMRTADPNKEGPVWFTGQTRTDVLDLIYEYHRELLEKRRAEWCDEAQEALEYIECHLELGSDDNSEVRLGASAALLMKTMVRRVLRAMPPKEIKP